MLLIYLSIALAQPKCYTAIDIKNSVCWAVCKHDGFDVGSYRDSVCICGYKYGYKDYTTTIRIAPRVGPTNGD